MRSCPMRRSNVFEKRILTNARDEPIIQASFRLHELCLPDEAIRGIASIGGEYLRSIITICAIAMLGVSLLIGGCGGGGGSSNPTLEVKAQPQGLSQGKMNATVLFRVYATGATSDPLVANNVALDGNDSCHIDVLLPAGTYDAWIKEPYRLARRIDGWVYNPSVPGVLDFGTLLAGDCNTDNTVTQSDADILQAAWGSVDVRADFNKDGIVNSIDFAMMSANWNKTGE